MKSKIIRLFIPESFRTRVILLTVFASFFTLIVTVLLSYNYSKKFLTETIYHSIMQQSSVLNLKLSEALIYKDLYTMFTTVESIKKSAKYLKNVYLISKDREYITDALVTKDIPKKIDNKNVIELPVKIGENKGIVGYLIYEIDSDYILDIALKDSFKIGLTEILTFVVLLFVVIFFTNLLITPMKVLNNYVQNLDISKLQRKIDLPWYASKELKEIAKNLEEISERLNVEILKNIEQEKKIMANSKMATIGMMSAGLAHELKNPAMTVLLIAKTLSKELEEKYIKDTEYLVKETNKMVKIVNDFLDIAKPISIQKEHVNINEIEKVLEDYVYINYSDKLEMLFINNLGADTIYTDSEKIIEIFRNLINNSFEASATQINIAFEDYGNKIMIGYHDNGFGIDKENIDKIFLPFYTTKKTGTGLGLYYIESIIHAMGGEINASSNEYGTTFIIKIPKG